MKVALVYAFKESDWFSCTVITKNLIKAYTKIFGEENILHVNYTYEREFKAEDLKKIQDTKVEKIIFVDHKPTPVNFLKALKKADGDELSSDREYIIHVFGDFPLYLTEWRSVAEATEGKKVKYICASEKQKNFVSQFFKQKDIVFHSPFPVSPEEFYFDDSKRSEIRKKLRVDEDAKLFIFTGRLSYQKRIVDLVESFYDALDKQVVPKNSKLLLVGPFDSLGMVYLGQSFLSGEYFRLVDRAIHTRPEYVENIIIHDPLKHEELNDYYNASDVFFSIGTYHDEDYGMSVAEAFCTGMPLVLTNWAGYFSFKNPEKLELTEFIPVKLGERLPIINKESINPAISKILQLSFDRKEVSISNLKYFSIDACADFLKEISETNVGNFAGRSEIMIRITNENVFKYFEMFKKDTDLAFNKLYTEVYQAYVE